MGIANSLLISNPFQISAADERKSIPFLRKNGANDELSSYNIPEASIVANAVIEGF
jgi:hypothetical protein